MDNLLIMIFLACLVALVIGMIKPELVVRWGEEENRTRKQVLKFYGIGVAVSFILFAMIGDSTSSSSGDSNKNQQDIVENKDENPILAADFHLVQANPKEYKGRTVEFYGKIFEVEKDTEGTYLQMFVLNNGSDGNTLVGIQDPNLDVKDGDIVCVNGIVKDSFIGKNAFGGEVTAPVITATSIEKSDYATAFAPALKVIEMNQEINQHGYIMTLNRVELAESETRVYLKVQNDTSDEISFYRHSAVMTQGANQLETQSNYKADYPEILSDIMPGVISEGVVTFAPVDPEGENIKLNFKGASDDYSLKFDLFTFECALSE